MLPVIAWRDIDVADHDVLAGVARATMRAVTDTPGTGVAERRRMKRLAFLIVLAAPPAFAQGFVQIENQQSGLTGTAPAPEVALAIGPQGTLEIAGGNVSGIESGNAVLTETTTAFWAGASITATPGEHRALFDTASGRWFVSADDATHRYLAVSQTGDLLGPWAGMTLPPATGTHVAVDARGVYGVGQHAGATDVIAIPLADALAGNASNATQLSAAEADLVPAVVLDGSPQLLVGRGTARTGNTTIDAWTIAWTGSTPALTGPVAIDIGAIFRDPPVTAVQPQGAPLVPTGGGRVRTAYVSQGHLYAIAATQVGGRAGAFAPQIDLASNSVVGLDTLGDGTFDLIDPALAVDPFGDLGIVAIATSATETPGMVFTGRPGFFAGAPLAYMQQSGSAGTYACQVTGGVSAFPPDSAIAFDGVNGFWTDAAIGASTGDCAFQTQLVQFAVESPIDYADDFPVDPVGDDAGGAPGGGCCSTSGGASSCVLAALVTGLLLARRRAVRSRSR